MQKTLLKARRFESPSKENTWRFKAGISLLKWGGILVVALIFGFFCTWYAYLKSGKSPGEIMDYSEQRLKGHTSLEHVTLPAIGKLREWLDQPSRQVRLQASFVVPRPPNLDTANSTAAQTSSQSIESTKRILRVGPAEQFRTIAQASLNAKDNDIVEIQAGEYYEDVAVWKQKKLTIRTRGGQARIIANGKIAEDKAIWVIRDGIFDIENIDFVGARATDHNGAGIRFENGRLHIRNCLFYGNDTGLLTTDENSELEIEDSEFAFNGFGDGLSHNLYVGKIRALKVIGSYFHHANIGHLIKSRAKYNYIAFNRITDESGGRSSYEINLPNGGITYLIGNIVQQGVNTENSTLIAYGEEGLVWPVNRLYLSSNTLVNDLSYGGAFLRVAEGTEKVVSANNLMIGSGEYHSKAVANESNNDIHAGWEAFLQASRYDYRLSTLGRLLPYVATTPELMPRFQYVSKRTRVPLEGIPNHPGAQQ